MNEFDPSKGWNDEEEHEENLSQKEPLPPGRGYKQCVVCGALAVYEIMHFPNGLDEWRTFCPRCNFLERFTLPSGRGKIKER